MPNIRIRKATALVLALAFVVATTPLAGATQAPAAEQAWKVTALFDALAAWLAPLRPGAGTGGWAEPARSGHRSSAPTEGSESAEPIGPGGGPQAGSYVDEGDAPTADPERGSGADPDG